ncbi:MAG: NADH-quinone oxidoreductase subunit [Verrucomicrobiota bacterium]
MADTDNKPTAAPADTFTVKVNGREVTVPRTTPDPVSGRPLPTTMIQACEAAGVDVPHYCYHPKLPVAGNCRMCLVEFGMPALGPDRQPILNPDGTPKILLQTLPYEPQTPRVAIACATPISPGMEIYTDTPSILKTREGILESLLINHPLDCPICDQAGECKLQEYSVQHGQAASRFAETKVHKPKQVDLGPRIMLDDERCILCTRCIRFTRDIAGDDALGIINRGSYNTISTYPGQAFDNNYTLNTVDLCPVGALTSKDFRFKMRVWFLKETQGVCTSCSTGCNITIGSRENQVHRYTPRQNDNVNSTWMCDAGRLNYKWLHRPDRLTQVLRRESPEQSSPIPWTQAVTTLVDRLQQADPGSVAIIASARQTTEELWLLHKIATHTRAKSDSIPRWGEPDRLLLHADRNPNTHGTLITHLSGPTPGENLPAIAKGIETGKIHTLIVFGEDVTRHGLSPELLKKLSFLAVSDILPNHTTALAHLLLPGCGAPEKRGTFINSRNRIQRFFKAVEPKGDARPESEFLSEIVQKLTGTELPTSMEGLFNQMATELKPLKGITWASLGDQGTDVPA